MPLLNNVRILVADDHELVRRGLMTLLSSRPDWSVCGQAARLKLPGVRFSCPRPNNGGILSRSETAEHILGCHGASSVAWDAKPFVLRASATAKCRRQRLLRSDGRPMRFRDNAVVAILLHIAFASLAAIHQQRQSSGIIFSGCGSCDFADCASTASPH